MSSNESDFSKLNGAEFVDLIANCPQNLQLKLVENATKKQINKLYKVIYYVLDVQRSEIKKKRLLTYKRKRIFDLIQKSSPRYLKWILKTYNSALLNM